MVSVMKVEKAPLESYSDIGGLDQQVQEIKEAVELPLTHPELYEEIGIKPPKVNLQAFHLHLDFVLTPDHRELFSTDLPELVRHFSQKPLPTQPLRPSFVLWVLS